MYFASMPARRLLRLLMVGILMLTGCKWGGRAPQPLQSPAARVELNHYAGSPLSGPQVRAVGADQLAKLWSVQIRLIALTTIPSEDFTRFAAQARLIVASRGGTPVTPSAALGSSVLVRQLEKDADIEKLLGDPLKRADIATLSGGVAQNVTAEVVLAVESVESTIDAPIRQAITLRIAPASDPVQYELAVMSDDLVPGSNVNIDADLPSFELPAAPPVARQETVLVDRRFEAGHDRLLLAIPMSFRDTPVRGILIELILNTEPDAAAREIALTAMQQGIARSAAVAAGRMANITAGSTEELALSSTLAALAQVGDEPRGALAYLASQTGATLSEAVVMVADKPQLQLLAKSVIDRSAQLQKRDRASVAWLLERTTIAALAAMANDASHPLSPAVYGALATFGGDVGRQLDALQSIASQSAGPAEMQNRLISEQMIYLEDNSPAARVRAYDWLRVRGLAPEGYDPLAPIRQRRLAIQKFQTASTQPTPIP